VPLMTLAKLVGYTVICVFLFIQLWMSCKSEISFESIFGNGDPTRVDMVTRWKRYF